MMLLMMVMMPLLDDAAVDDVNDDVSFQMSHIIIISSTLVSVCFGQVYQDLLRFPKAYLTFIDPNI